MSMTINGLSMGCENGQGDPPWPSWKTMPRLCKFVCVKKLPFQCYQTVNLLNKGKANGNIPESYEVAERNVRLSCIPYRVLHSKGIQDTGKKHQVTNKNCTMASLWQCRDPNVQVLHFANPRVAAARAIRETLARVAAVIFVSSTRSHVF
jgi:hypothetical protein